MTFIEETLSAGRGILALLAGRRNAPHYFDFGLGGLAGSLAAFFIALAVNAYMPVVMGIEVTEPAWQGVLLVIVLFALQIGFAALVLRQFGRMDGLVPYLVADNWATFFVTLVAVLLAVLGVSGEITLLALGLLVIVLEVNIARLVVTLSFWQIVAFLVAQMVGVMLGLMGLALLIPESAATTALG